MSNITPQLTKASDDIDRDGWTVVWGPMVNGDVGIGATLVAHADRSFQFEGTFGAGGAVLVEGSNDLANWRTLNDPQGTPLSITSPAIKQITEVVRSIRPRIVAGDGTTEITVSCLFRRALR